MLLLPIACVVLMAVRIGAISRYCSGVHREDLVKQFDNCVNISSLESGSYSLHEKQQIEQKYLNMLSILDKIMVSMNEQGTSKNETKNLFLDILDLVKLANSHSQLKFCVTSICSLFKNCEFPINIEYQNFENDAMVAARMAALLTGLILNQKIENQSYLSKLNLYTLLRLSISEHENIYDAKVAFLRNPGESRVIIHGTKSLRNRIIEVKDFKQILENTKNFQWYYKWLTDKRKLVNVSKINWIYKSDDLKNSLEGSQAKAYSQFVYPLTVELNNIRFVSNITYDCLSGIWNRIVSVPFFDANGDIRGVVSISISLNNFDLKQCGESEDAEEDSNSTEKYDDPFFNTDKCDRESTICINEPGKGFVLGSYKCQCKPGFYRNLILNSSQYACLKCSEGCDTCEDNRPCKTDIPIQYKRAALIINLICILISLILILLLWYHSTQKILKTSSPRMLFMVLLGAIVSYSEILPMYFEPSYWTCMSAQVLYLEGFLLAYGALVLKTWRECKLFYVRSVKTIKITDQSLMKRLGIIMGIGTAYLIIWALRRVDSPRGEQRLDPFGLKYEACTVTEWNFVSMAFQLAILLWGAVLSIQVRRASIAFKETKLVTWAIFNEGVVLCFVILINVLLKNTKVSCYVPFIINFIRIHLTITIMLSLLFSYKIYTILIARKKPFHANQAPGLLNSITVNDKDGDQKSFSVHEETEKERDLKIEVQRLYRQIEEMRSLSMRIANPHLLQKKSRFGYQNKKSKFYKSKNLPSENEISKVLSNHDAESQSFLTETSKAKKLGPIEESN
ncbi:G-coupled receptor -like protein [Brachionus plicatilis]|uniref:G-coupled receptor-like protein n=1 Tax=Brachionus plicatilis TaxID=10195 RepID=A0A3M7RJB9_BRAPC|nr:G-coupled receptor -like protein [Brachionus plicatilis]